MMLPVLWVLLFLYSVFPCKSSSREGDLISQKNVKDANTAYTSSIKYFRLSKSYKLVFLSTPLICLNQTFFNQSSFLITLYFYIHHIQESNVFSRIKSSTYILIRTFSKLQSQITFHFLHTECNEKDQKHHSLLYSRHEFLKHIETEFENRYCIAVLKRKLQSFT